jgi:voltage-gated potassium channel
MPAPSIAQRFGDLDPAERLGDLDLFADCTRTQLRKIDALTTDLSIRKDSVLIREDSAAREFIVIRTGSARVTRQTDDGVTTVANVGTGTFLGEQALLTRTRWTATATATTDLEVLVSSIDEFRSILEIAPSVAHRLQRSPLALAGSMPSAA